MRVSINTIADLTGKDRRTIKKLLGDLPFSDGPKGGLEYDSTRALPRVYGLDRPEGGEATLTEARTRESLAKAHKTELEVQTMRRERIPLEAVNDALESALSLTKQIIMGSALTETQKREVCETLRDVPLSMRW